MLLLIGHIKAVKRILSYLKTFPKGRVIVEVTFANHSVFHIEDYYLGGFYKEFEEDIPKVLSDETWQRVRMTVYVDADHANDLVTRRSITEFLVTIKIRKFDGYLLLRRQWRRMHCIERDHAILLLMPSPT
jgi:hypothetical protein